MTHDAHSPRGGGAGSLSASRLSKKSFFVFFPPKLLSCIIGVHFGQSLC